MGRLNWRVIGREVAVKMARYMKRNLAHVAGLSLIFTSRFCFADDAYDDEDEQQRPEDDFEETDSGEEESTDSLKSGGLEAPGSLPETGDGRTDIEKELDKSDEKDAGRGLNFFWLNAELGFLTMGLSTLGNQGLVAEGAAASGSGFVYGGALGFRLLYFTLGARFRRATLDVFTPWSLVGEAGLRVPIGRLEPYATLSAGYVGISDSVSVTPIGGADVRLGAGLDFYFSDSFSVGVATSGELLFLSGGGASSTGGGFATTALIGLHY